MNTKTRFVLIFTLALLAGAALVVMSQAAPGAASLTPGGAPTVVAYQGEVRVSGAPYTGDGYFKFAVVDAAGTTTYWSNDGSSTGGSEPTAAVQLTVSEGLFSVLLGDTTLGGMTQALAAGVFSQPDRYLRVWFSENTGGPFSQLTPDTRVAAVPYALQAQEAADAGTVDGHEGAALEESAEIDAGISAHAAIADAHHARYTSIEVWATVLANDGPGSGLDADTVDGQHASQLGADYQNVVVVAKSGGDYTSVQAAIDSITDAAASNPYLVWVAPGVYQEQVTMKPFVHLQGAGQEATVISSTANSVDWPPTQATLLLASDTSLRYLTVGNGGVGARNVALLATASTTRTLVADMAARAQGGGTYNYAIYLAGSGVGVTLHQVTALGENGSISNYGLYNYIGATATLRGGSYTGRGGIYTWGISNSGSDATLEAESVTALAENGSSMNHGLNNYEGAATLRGGSFIGRGGADAHGIFNSGSDATLETESVTALGENGSGENNGLNNRDLASARLRGGSFTGRGGTSTRGIYNYGSGTPLDAESVTALGEDGSSINYGLYNMYPTSGSGAEATLRGSSFTGRGGTFTRGIYNYNGMLEADRVTALGENGSNNNYGLFISSSNATANVTQSVLVGANNSVRNIGGSITVSNSRLVGGAVSGTVTCVLVTRGTTISTNGSTCP
jgi:hypothetical protein